MAIPTYKLFQPGNKFFTMSGNPDTDEEDAVTLDPVIIGDVNLPSGQVITGDPLFLVADYYKPYLRTVPPGVYPAIIGVLSTKSVYQGETKWYPVNAAAMLRFKEGEPVVWEMALAEGQDPATLGPREFFGYGVDSGNAGFFTPEALDVIVANDDKEGGMLKRCGYKSHEFFTLPDHPELNVAMCLAGEGDGSYAAYWGLDGDGEIVCLATDFALLYDPKRLNEVVDYEE